MNNGSSSGSHFFVEYNITAENERKALDIATKAGVEQSVEMPVEAVPASALGSLPEIQSCVQSGQSTWHVTLAFPSVLIDDATQFLNILYGNISLYRNIKIIDVSTSALSLLGSGPAFGIHGIRKRLNISSNRALSCTALKPIGLTSEELAQAACQFASGGIDIIKDDHGLTSQTVAPFIKRVTNVVEAVHKGTQKSGKKTLYFPNITTSPFHIMERFGAARDAGASGVLVCPQLAGLSVISELAKQNELPVMAHPAFSGGYTIPQNEGISPALYYGKIWRSLGADAVIFPNAGGRFTFTREECCTLHQTLISPLADMKPSFPVPAGGVQLNTLDALLHQYGNDTIYLIGGDLYKNGTDLTKTTRQFHQKVISYEQSLKSN